MDAQQYAFDMSKKVAKPRKLYVANRLKSLRENRGLTQEQAAEALELTQPTYQRYENRTRKIPHEALQKMASFYGCTPWEIMESPKITQGRLQEGHIKAEKTPLSTDLSPHKQAANAYSEMLDIVEKLPPEARAALVPFLSVLIPQVYETLGQQPPPAKALEPHEKKAS